MLSNSNQQNYSIQNPAYNYNQLQPLPNQTYHQGNNFQPGYQLNHPQNYVVLGESQNYLGGMNTEYFYLRNAYIVKWSCISVLIMSAISLTCCLLIRQYFIDQPLKNYPFLLLGWNIIEFVFSLFCLIFVLSKKKASSSLAKLVRAFTFIIPVVYYIMLMVLDILIGFVIFFINAIVQAPVLVNFFIMTIVLLVLLLLLKCIVSGRIKVNAEKVRGS